MLNFWEGMRRFAAKYAYRWAHNSNGRIPHEDLMQAGFLAMLDAVDRFDPGREDASFLSVLRLTIKTRFAEESGIRTKKRDALMYAESADAPAYMGEDSPTIAETLPDKSAGLAFMDVEYRDFLAYCRNVIRAALATLPDRQAAIVRLHRLEGRTLDEIAMICGLSDKQAACDAKERALEHLARGKYRRELWECLAAFIDFRAAKSGPRNGSRTEAAALAHIEKERIET